METSSTVKINFAAASTADIDVLMLSLVFVLLLASSLRISLASNVIGKGRKGSSTNSIADAATIGCSKIIVGGCGGGSSNGGKADDFTTGSSSLFSLAALILSNSVSGK
ncbi:MAG: hypothetical protein IPK14_21505 [Blastocatellia bacterium]|nr:hypothetical protein [Blastocatellia bacterium]